VAPQLVCTIEIERVSGKIINAKGKKQQERIGREGGREEDRDTARKEEEAAREVREGGREEDRNNTERKQQADPKL